MATPNSGLCKFCHARAKFERYEYCGRTCAKRAAAQCVFCKIKPKSSGHSFCSRTCAIQAKQQHALAFMHVPAATGTQTRTPEGPLRYQQTKQKGSLPIRFLRALHSKLNKHDQPAVLACGATNLNKITQVNPSVRDLCILCRQSQAAEGSRFCGRRCKKMALQ